MVLSIEGTGVYCISLAILMLSPCFSVVRQVDRELIHKYRHPGAVYGGDWSPHNK